MRITNIIRASRSTGWTLTEDLSKKIYYYSQFPATGVSLRQMVQFGSDPSDGTLFRASQFILEELPIRLAHRVRELDSLPNGLNDMPSIKRVKDWYAQSFEELTTIPVPALDEQTRNYLHKNNKKENVKVSIPTHPPGNGNNNNGWDRNDIAIKPESGIKPTLFSLDPTPEDWHAEGFRTKFNGTGAAASIASKNYFASVEPGVNWPPEVREFNDLVTQKLQKIKARHDGVVSSVAQGVLEWKNTQPKIEVGHSVQSFLDRFYMSRIGIRMLIGQHIGLNLDRGNRDGYVGIISTRANIKDIALAAVDNARFMCEEWYGLFEAPKVEIVCNPDINFMYVPGHLSHMFFETLKNSLRAVVETYGPDADEFPPIKVIVAEGQEDITIKVSDEGGGIPRSEVPFVWTYLYTTVKDTPLLDPDFSRSDFKAPMAGFGYGLPISRLYARYFGGDLKLISMEGYGTDVYLHLNRLSSSSEPLE